MVAFRATRRFPHGAMRPTTVGRRRMAAQPGAPIGVVRPRDNRMRDNMTLLARPRCGVGFLGNQDEAIDS